MKSLFSPLLVSAFSLSSFFFTSVATASAGNQYQVQMEIQVDRQVVSSPRLHILEGERAKISQQSKQGVNLFSFEVLASEAPEVVADGIQLAMTAEYLTGGQSMRTNVHVLVKPGGEAVIDLPSVTGELIELRLIAQRVNPSL